MTGICTVCTLNWKCLYFIERAKWDIIISDSFYHCVFCTYVLAPGDRWLQKNWHWKNDISAVFLTRAFFKNWLSSVWVKFPVEPVGCQSLGDRWVPHAAKFSTPGKPFEDCFTIMGLWRCVINWPAMNGFTGVSRHAHHYCYLTGKSNC